MDEQKARLRIVKKVGKIVVPILEESMVTIY